MGSAYALAATVDVRVEGIRDDAVETNIQGFLAIAKLEGNDSARPRAIRRLHRRAEQDIRDALRPFGYYNPVIRSELEPVDGGYTATYVVDTGPPTTLRDIRIEITGPAAGESEWGGANRGRTGGSRGHEPGRYNPRQ